MAGINIIAPSAAAAPLTKAGILATGLAAADLGVSSASNFPTIAGMTYPFATAHRGNSDVFPENTIEALEGSVSLGATHVKFDVFRGANGAAFLMHDTTVDRTTDGTGLCSAYTLPGIKSLNVDAATWFSTRWPSLRVPSLTEVLDRLANAPVISFIQSKTTGTTAVTQICTALTKRGMASRAIVVSDLLADINVIVAAGCSALFQATGGGETTPSSLAGRGAWGISMDYQTLKTNGTVATQIAAYKAVGLKVVLWGVTRQAAYDDAIANGADGVNSDDCFYASRNYTAYRLTTASWATDGSFSHGMQSTANASGDTESTSRGDFIGSAGNYWWKLAGTGYVLAGPLSPVASTPYTLTVPIVLLSTTGSASNWRGVLFANPDDNNSNTSGGGILSGYQAQIREDGSLRLYGSPGGGGAQAQIGSSVTTTKPQILTTTADLTAGVAVTSLPVTALTVAVKVGHQFMLPTGQVATVSTAGIIGDTAVAVTSITPTALVASGASLYPVVTVKVTRNESTGAITVVRNDETTAGSISATDSTWTGRYVMFRTSVGAGSVAYGKATVT